MIMKALLEYKSSQGAYALCDISEVPSICYLANEKLRSTHVIIGINYDGSFRKAGVAIKIVGNVSDLLLGKEKIHHHIYLHNIYVFILLKNLRQELPILTRGEILGLEGDTRVLVNGPIDNTIIEVVDYLTQFPPRSIQTLKVLKK